MPELKVTLYFLWRIEHMEGPFRALESSDFDTKDLGLSTDDVHLAIRKAVERGTILESQHETNIFYFLNSPRGRAAAEAFANGQWNGLTKVVTMPFERPNVFKLYEENIGMLTPLIADALEDGEETYSAEWVAEAIELAVKNNKRNWRYCEAILKRWKEEGHGKKQDQQDTEDSRRKYVEGKYSDYIEH